ncbi:PilX N-terminal domain-containing pilus assembly protein [Chromobacterium sp. IIBBL 290-4]|uniref:pilus assembly PilX family protein n=1 Tax=Chromobacterium sp. IIBBL 290-4 TaxID=2953890 RepID=UPI0020B6F3CE|nr:PilX N-terminal domain-containing pilus assembly protein [Chromobacterium sp. IIBBL 290-4]UTH74332.1 PilX N-terminal domain-containing pilus assembly protein [Chromobacterium sp. IIBBL 290-4]
MSARLRQHGFTLIAALMILIVITIIGLAMMRSVGLQGRMAGNTREKGRAFESAQSALQYAEWWLTQSGNANAQAVNCSNASTSVAICSNALATPATTPWAAGYSYAPPYMSLPASGTSGGSQTFYQDPQLYIQYLGLNAAGNGALYQLTALGYGGNAYSVVVLQSTFTLYSGVSNLGK